ncbi:MAG: helix-turn-helix transcriptional regulator [Paraburkholderia tropica]|uniref:Xre family transcriptional regulator n=1 Tax=Paraburkholderia tropica TaxID=92647 RepID=A0ABX5MM30_9BURK|nr:helix-turn-helix transcriptional regulator [Paraburkholderia tropica]MDE1140986.1 helix-turn-helix transcriptional regulator [Paraburkholderia tropica]PXX14604.1 Xre family transcriptional regulator [Paraburkholderia tropica]PZW79669.1 Xre family transcriptional regulator [Paraburkholderia tropica]
MPRTLPRPIDRPDPLAQDMAALGLLVRNRRAQSELRIDDAAQMLGVSKDVLSRLENGRSVSLDKVFLILNGLGLSLLVLPRSEASTALRKLTPPGTQETP